MAKKKVQDPAVPGPDVTLYMIYFGFAVLGTLWVALQLGNLLSSTKQNIPINPIAIAIALVKGKLHWPFPSTLIVLLVILAVIAYVMIRKELAKRRSKGVLAVDAKAQHMGQGGAIAALTEKGVREKATQLDVSLGYNDSPGVPIGISVAEGIPLYGSYEDLHLDIWGPRQGKSTSRVIPAILSAIGPVIATSNKRDVVDATRGVRERKGDPRYVYVFDPQGVAMGPEETVTWYWDPLRWVDARRPGCEMRAAQLAGHFADADSGSDSKGDAYFDTEAEDLLASLFLAAAVAQQPIVQVWEWVTNSRNPEPIEVLRQATSYWQSADLSLTASSLSAQYNTDERTKSGIFGTAKKMIGCLKMSNVHPWITPGGDRYEFDELEFLERNGTLYSLSLEGRGSAAPLVSALTAAVIDVAMRQATQMPHGRLRVPLLAVLDEAANVVRWKDLPKQYSHFGSRGIVVMTVLQSWAQGARCWGEDGMAALWSAANIKVLGSGIDDTKFLTERSEVIGDYDSISQSMSESKGGKSYSRSLGSSRTFNVNALVTLPRGRIIVFTSAAPAVLVRTIPWWEGEYDSEVRASLERYEPGARRTTTMSDLVQERELAPANQPDQYGQPQEVQPL
ncbi:type IV secretory system conjugative DNA transfer family protein [Nocardia alni]|uniref:type IV secretory system conjugative DNA transfer family protein n=1 Tax=Nocardia alni TaxID=2815723 RepID=UPI001C24B531|nr:type IV secretory system conjugative DNA transfer family protein [Nocardia alni]